MGTMTAFVRPLTEVERRIVNSSLRQKQRRLKSFWKGVLTAGLLIFGVFAIVPMIVSRGRAYIPVVAWFGIVTLISVWVYFSEKPKEESAVRTYAEALSKNEAHVTRIQSDEMVELEEEEDEGACYAFQLENNKIVFVSGQDYYASARFPNTDFSLIEIYGDGSVPVEGFIEKDGKKLKPQRKISAKVKSKLRIPFHLEVIDGSLVDLENLLKP